MGDVMGDREGGHGWQQGQQWHEAADRAVGVAVLARFVQVPAHHALKGHVAQAGDKTDGGKNDAGFQ